MWQQIAIALVLSVIGYALAPRPPRPRPASIQDIQVPTSEEGRPVPVVFGTVRVQGPNILWYGDLQTSAIKVDSK